MRKLLLGLGLFALAIGGGVSSAVAQQFSDKPIKHFTEANVSALLIKMGATGVTSSKDGNTTIVRFEVNGATHVAAIVACPKGQPGCLGLLLLVPVRLAEGTFTHDVINGFNDASAFGKAVRSDDGKSIVITRYVISDNGILEGNLAVNISVFAAMPNQFASFLASQVVASADKGTAQPVAMSTEPKKPEVAPHSEFQSLYDFAAKQPAIVLPK